MPDFKTYVRSHLPPLKVRPEREAAIVEELALQLSFAYDEARSAGLDDATAFEKARHQIEDWNTFGARVNEAERQAPAEIPQSPAGRFGAGFWRDIRFALRGLRRSPGFAAA